MAEGKTIPQRFRSTVTRHGGITALMTKDSEGTFQHISYQQVYHSIQALGTRLASMGVKRQDHLGIISDNRMEWIITDLAILGLGAVDVPRGSDSTAEEIGYILAHADCALTFAEDRAQAEKILSFKKDLPLLKTLILYDAEGMDKIKNTPGVELLSFQTVMEEGERELEKKTDFFDKEIEKGEADDLATILYTSGTTGPPKGVLITHRNFSFQLDRVLEHLDLRPGHSFLSVLPVWHSFERTVEYIIFDNALSMAYSKPVGAVMLPDMAAIRPQWMVSVPRIWEGVYGAIMKNLKKEKPLKRSIAMFFISAGQSHAALRNMLYGLVPEFHKRSRVADIAVSILPYILLTPLKLLGNVLVFNKLKAKLGGKFIAGVSGAGALPGYVDMFFQAAGILLLEGYGLTETAPILSVRKQYKPVTGTVGPLLKDIHYRVVDTNGNEVGPGHKGVLHVKSEQVMQGYYKNPEATAAVLQDGWLNTGDIVMATINHELKILGRAKETVVLLGGENIEPVPIEDKLLQSEYIHQAMVVGQDKKFLGVLIVPHMESLVAYAVEKEIEYVAPEELLELSVIQEFYHDIVQSLINPKTGFKPFERIYRIKFIPQPFEVGKELTQTLKMKRDVISSKYHREIESLFV
ncbi:MAG: AMP-binding protein [Spirochaetales bacterium]|nr:AMP-binding protein [Spirochaetales bacterium]